MSFEVASIRPAEPGKFHPPSFALSADDSFGNPGGVLSADFPLPVFIEFAYKLLLSNDQRKVMLAKLPEWVSKERFSIRAKAEGNPSKDQMRLMVQSLLAERFKLAAHFEMQESSVSALMTISPAKLGPNLVPHSQGPACERTPRPDEGPSKATPVVYPPVCDLFMAHVTSDHMIQAGSRNAKPEVLANALASLAGLDRTVVDQTGLIGRYDFTLKWSPEPGSPMSPPGANTFDPQGPTFLQALREQLGLKLQPSKATLQTLVIDHLERPTEN